MDAGHVVVAAGDVGNFRSADRHADIRGVYFLRSISNRGDSITHQSAPRTEAV